MKKRVSALIVGTATVLTVAGLAAPAQAADAAAVSWRNGVMAAHLTYNDSANDDTFTTFDDAEDGLHVRGWLLSGGGTVLREFYNGVVGEGATVYYDLAKGKDYVIKVCLVTGYYDTTPTNCGSKVIHDD